MATQTFAFTFSIVRNPFCPPPLAPRLHFTNDQVKELFCKNLSVERSLFKPVGWWSPHSCGRALPSILFLCRSSPFNSLTLFCFLSFFFSFFLYLLLLTFTPWPTDSDLCVCL